jgi:hypothetical protein
MRMNKFLCVISFVLSLYVLHTNPLNAATTTLGIDITTTIVISPDGTVSNPPNGPSLINLSGIWTWGTPVGDGQYNINLNGVAKGQGILMEIADGGKIYVNTIAKGWWIWDGFRFSGSGPPPGPPPPPPPPPPLSVVITVTPGTPTIPDTTTKGTLVASFTVSMSDSSLYTGTIVFGPPNFDNNSVFSLSPTVKNPDGSVSGQILVNPNGPGVGPNPDTVTDHVTLVGTQ